MNDNNKNCTVCDETYNNSTRLCVECICEFECCRKCVKVYIESRSEEAHCMSCKKIWSFEMLSEKMDKKYMTNVYKTHRENILIEKELSKLPESQIHVEEQIRVEKIDLEIAEINKEISSLCRKLNELKTLKIFGVSSEKKEFIRACPWDTCRGFLSTALKCGTCERFVCGKCKEPKSTNHVCDVHILENIKSMENDCKGCPGCGKMIYKIEGCNQMYCTPQFGGCGVAFNWKTLRIEIGVIHNPHYFEWQRKNGTNQRTPGDVQCGRTLDHHFVQRLDKKFTNTGQKLLNATWALLPRYTVNDDNLDLRIMYIRGKIDKEYLKKNIQKRDKANRKKTEVHNVLNMYITCCTDILYRSLENTERHNTKNSKVFQSIMGEFIIVDEIKKLQEYVDTCLIKIQSRYNCKLNVFDNKPIQSVLF